MAGRNLRELWQAMLRKALQDQQARPVRPPEPSYFKQDDKDAAKPDARRPVQRQPRPVVAAPGSPERRQAPVPAKPGDAKKGFDEATDAKRILADIALETRFKTAEARAMAIEFREDIQRARDQVEREHQEALADAWRPIDKITSDPRPPPPEATRDANQKLRKVYDDRNKAMEKLDQDLKVGFAQIDTMDVKLADWGPYKKRLTTDYETDPTLDFNLSAEPPEWLKPTGETSPIPNGEDREEEPRPPIDLLAEFNRHSVPAPERDRPRL